MSSVKGVTQHTASMVLVDHKWTTSFNLGFQDCVPEFLSGDGLEGMTFPLVRDSDPSGRDSVVGVLRR